MASDHWEKYWIADEALKRATQLEEVIEAMLEGREIPHQHLPIAKRAGHIYRRQLPHARQVFSLARAAEAGIVP